MPTAAVTIPAVRALSVHGVRLVRDSSTGYTRDNAHSITSPRECFQFMQPLCESEIVESFWVLPLDAQYRVASFAHYSDAGGSGRVVAHAPLLLTRGTVNSSLVAAREVFRAAIAANAVAVMLCHNHPSGDPTPSDDDRVVTAQLVAAGRLLGIPVVDHIIIGAGRYMSFAEAGLL